MSTAAWDALEYEYIMYADPCDINSPLPPFPHLPKRQWTRQNPIRDWKRHKQIDRMPSTLCRRHEPLVWLVLMMRTWFQYTSTHRQREDIRSCPVSTRNERSKANICSCFSRFPLQCAIGIARARHHQRQHRDDQESHQPTSILKSVCVKNKTNLYLLLCSSQCAQFVLVSSAKHQEPEGAGWEK